MKYEKIEVTYFVKRSQAYQSIDTGMTVTVTLDEGEKPCKVYAHVMNEIATCVETGAATALEDVVRAASLDH